MTFEIALVLGILAISLVLFISEVIRMDVVALLVLGALAITGLVDSNQAFAGFSNSAVITVWAMFILSEGLTRTGIADIIGRQVMRLAGRREIAMITVIMITGAVLSAFMNNIGVAALMLPVVVEVARRTRIAPSRLLMPLAYSTLLGGLMTLIGTPPNLLISESIRTFRTVRFHTTRRRSDGDWCRIRRIGRTLFVAENACCKGQTCQSTQPALALQAAGTHIHVARADRFDIGWQDAR